MRRTLSTKARTALEFRRIYGSKERVAFVQTLPCVICFARPSVNAHTASGGMGRKAGFESIVPLCHHCHRIQHDRGWSALNVVRDELQRLAKMTQERWVFFSDREAE